MAASTLAQHPSDAPEGKLLDKRTKELHDVVERVYRKYGANLTAFYRDAHREAQKESEKKSR
jgi:hypothetical protein